MQRSTGLVTKLRKGKHAIDFRWPVLASATRQIHPASRPLVNHYATIQANLKNGNMRVVTIPVRSDNYTYLLIDPKTNTAAAIDVYDVPKTLKAATENKVDIVSVLTTHHHQDHAGGNSVRHSCAVTILPLTTFSPRKS